MQLTPAQQEHFARQYLAERQRARTDLFWLCNEVLAPPSSKILVRHAHGKIVEHCQQFKGYKELIHPETFRIVASEPICAMWDLEGPRDRMLLVSRGHLKTTIHTIGQAIQWILNYPDVRILLCTATGEQSERIIKEIKGHFQFNPRFRFLFPEFCPKKSIQDFGNAAEFTVPNRTRKELKEPTVMTASIGKVIASTHHDVVMCSDVVSEANTKTKGQIQEAKDFFGYLEPLRERGPSKNGESNVGWKFVEGTIYDFADYYQTILDHEAQCPADQKQWMITRQSCWVDKEKKIPLWPERFPAKELDRILNSPEVGPYIFSSQYELNPVAPGSGLATKEQIRFFPAHLVKQLMPRYRVYTTIDLATLDGSNVNGDYCSLVTGGWDGNARLDVLSIQNGRFTDKQVVDLMFLIQQMFPSNQEFRIQKDQISGGLKSLLRREMEQKRKWLNVKYVPIPTNESKNHRIIRNLQGWFSLGYIRFADSISCKTELIDQILRFPRGAHDDILDALADQMHNEKGESIADAIPRESNPQQELERDYGFNPYESAHESEMSEHYAEVVGL
jgi:hypothetical protein